MTGSYLLALDQGTTSSRAILFDSEQNIVGSAQKEFTQHYPHEGWVEHDPMEIWSSQYAVMMELIAQTGVSPAEIAAIGITNQRETTIIWEKATGRPVYHAIVWQCRRTAALCEELKADDELTSYIREHTGLLPDAYFSATKLKWVLDTWRGQGSGPVGGSCFLERWTPGSSGSSPAAGSTSPTIPTPAVPCSSTSSACAGMSTSAGRWTSPWRCCLR